MKQLRWVLPRIVAAVVLLASGMAESLPAIQTHNNRTSAGQLRDGVLTVRLEIGRGLWHPETEDGAALAVYGFGEVGKTLQNPGPLIRVPEGTEVQASVRNTLATPMTVHGLCTRPCADSSAFTLAAGETRQVNFKAATAGLFYYWAARPGATLLRRPQDETQLNGAFVVDPPGSVPEDAIFLITVMSDGPAAISDRLIATINGKSWPHTPRFEPRVGETVRWRWINTSEEDHAMHLHGFYYRIEAVGDGKREQIYTGEARPRVVTQHIGQGGTFDMTWTPERPGRWLFHCHMVSHMVPPQLPKAAIRPASVKPAETAETEHHEMGDAGMGQLVLGITAKSEDSAASAPAWHAARKLQLVVGERDRPPLYKVTLNDPGSRPAANADAALIGPPIVLTREEPVEIEVVNRLKQPTAIHWHGIELESYYDGVPGWTGAGNEITPAIQPGESFVARMAPPRAGTFIYHTHWHDEAQLKNGVYGPLIVLAPGAKFDPRTDLVFLLSLGDGGSFGDLLLINGAPQSMPLRLQAGTPYRMRLINIAPNNVAMEVSLHDAQGLAQWKMIAKDGADLAASEIKPSAARTPITVGETCDFEFASATPRELLFDVYLPGPKIHHTQTLVFAPAKAAP